MRQRPGRPTDDPDEPDFVERSLVPGKSPFLIERHVPTRFREPYHHHTSVEINFLDGVDMSYSFSGRPVAVPPGRLTLFWAAAPHRVIEVAGQGRITNIYLALGRFLGWGLPGRLVEDLSAGRVLAARTGEGDRAWLDRLLAERDRDDPDWQRLHLGEIEARLRRLALEGWDVLLTPAAGAGQIARKGRAMQHVEAMLRFVADRFPTPITVEDIAAAAGVSPSHAMALFRDVMGAPVMRYVTRTRLSHACMLLAETRAKVVAIAMDCGFASVSAFYAAFRAELGTTPAAFRRTHARRSPAR
jgi:AraC-like DNA-binding protein